MCGQKLLTSHGLRSLSPDHPDYAGHYVGNGAERDRVYHQGTVWGWLLGAFALAHLRVYSNPAQAQKLLEPLVNYHTTHRLGNLSEISDGDAPMTARSWIAPAWTVAEVSRVWLAIED